MTRLEMRGRISPDSLAFAVPSASLSSTSGRNSIRCVTTYGALPQPPAGRSCGSSLQATLSGRPAIIIIVVMSLRMFMGTIHPVLPPVGRDSPVYSLPPVNCYK